MKEEKKIRKHERRDRYTGSIGKKKSTRVKEFVWFNFKSLNERRETNNCCFLYVSGQLR